MSLCPVPGQQIIEDRQFSEGPEILQHRIVKPTWCEYGTDCDAGEVVTGEVPLFLEKTHDNAKESEHQTTFFDIVLFYKNNKADYPIIWVYAQNISDVLSGLFTPKINTQKRPLCKKCEEKKQKRYTFGKFSAILNLLYHGDK